MPVTTRLIARSDILKLGSSEARLQFGNPGKESPGPRHLLLDGDPAFTLSFWCGSSALVFERLKGATNTLSSEDLQELLNLGLDTIDEAVIAAVSTVVPKGRYVAALLSIEPRLVTPSGEGDYFAHEQVEHRGVNSFWGLPQNTRTPYYRTSEWQRDDHDHYFEFVVPMVPPTWNSPTQVSLYEQVLPVSNKPTVLALSIVDRTQLFDRLDAHSGLIHFVLDGHHKIEAAAKLGTRVRMLTLLAIDEGLEDPKVSSKVFDTFA